MTIPEPVSASPTNGVDSPVVDSRIKASPIVGKDLVSAIADVPSTDVVDVTEDRTDVSDEPAPFKEHPQTVESKSSASADADLDDKITLQVLPPGASSSELTRAVTVTVSSECVHAPRSADIFQASPADLVHEIKTYLMDLKDWKAETCFALAYQGQKLQDYSTMDALISIGSPSTDIVLETIPEDYTEKDARVHLARFLDFLRAGDAQSWDTMTNGWAPRVPIFDAIMETTATVPVDKKASSGASKGKKGKTTIDKGKTNEKSKTSAASHAFHNYSIEHPAVEISNLIPASVLVPQQEDRCVLSLSLSGWNPVPVSRKLAGIQHRNSCRSLFTPLRRSLLPHDQDFGRESGRGHYVAKWILREWIHRQGL